MRDNDWTEQLHLFAKPFALLLGLLSILLIGVNVSMGAVGLGISGIFGLFCAWLLWSLKHAHEWYKGALAGYIKDEEDRVALAEGEDVKDAVALKAARLIDEDHQTSELQEALVRANEERDTARMRADDLQAQMKKLSADAAQSPGRQSLPGAMGFADSAIAESSDQAQLVVMQDELARMARERDHAVARQAELETRLSDTMQLAASDGVSGDEKMNLLQAAQSELERAKSRELALVEEKTRIEAALSEVEQELADARERAKKAADAARSASEDASAKSGKLAELQSALKEAQSRESMLEEDRARFEQELADAERELQDAQSLAKEAEAAARHAAEDADAVSRKLSEVQRELEDANARERALLAEKARFEQALAAAEQRAEAAQLESEGLKISAETSAKAAEERAKKLSEMVGGNLVFGSLAGRYQIDYRDAKGQDAEREIAVYAIVERSGKLNLDSFSADQISCRTYRADRIQRLRDMDSGEVVTRDIPEWLLSRNDAGVL